MSLEQGVELRWYEKTGFVVLMLLVFFPVGLVLLWRSRAFPQRGKINLSIIMAAIVAMAVFVALGSDGQAPPPGDKQSQVQTPQQNAPQANAPVNVRVASEKVKGIGISRSKILAAYAEKNDAFSGQEGAPVNGQPNWVGRSSNGLATLQLIGNPDDLTSASVVFGVAKDNIDSAAAGMIHMYILLNTIFPDWQDCNKWIVSAIDQVSKNEQDTVETKRDGKLIKFQVSREIGFFGLTVKVAE